MIIFLDTNIIYNNWKLNNANFQYLFNFLENTNSHLFISDIVCDEVENIYLSEYEILKKGFEDNLKKANSFLLNIPALDISLIASHYSLRGILSEKTNNIIFFPYGNILNKDLVARAIKRTRPFQNDDKGFRDTLIWLSFLEQLSANKTSDKVAFINNNSLDFFNKDKSELHSDLKNDLDFYGLQNTFVIYSSLKEFINSEVSLEVHSFTSNQILEEFIYPYERDLENLIELYFSSQTANWFDRLIRKSSNNIYQEIKFLINFEFHIEEGIEDASIMSWSQINKSSFYTEMNLQLRRVYLKLTIPNQIYDSNKEVIDKNYYDSETKGDHTTLYCVHRIYLNISFATDSEENTFSALVINSIG